MKNPKYRLHTVLEIRARNRDEAAKQLALRQQELEKARAELERRRQNLHDCLKKQSHTSDLLDKNLKKGIAVNNLLQHRRFLDDLKKIEENLNTEVQDQAKIVSLAEDELQNAHENLIESVRDLQVIETHKSNWQTAEKSESSKREQKRNDEIGLIMHGGRKSSEK